ncbi:GLE1-like protein-domain-containing protein [Xylariomycetidae sp. FL0641]|nr:GLE1-like protein-domain-containing protein [Xylariomycetidae sp. FL0641]
MPHSSPVGRRSLHWSSPNCTRLSDLFREDRHTESSHQDALAAAQAEHDRVRETAIRVYKDHELQEEQRRLRKQEERIREEQKKEEERIRAEARVRAEQERLRALKAQKVPELPPEPTRPEPAADSRSQVNGSTAPAQAQPTSTTSQPQPKASLFGAAQSTSAPGPQQHSAAGLFGAAKPAAKPQDIQTNGFKPAQPSPFQQTPQSLQTQGPARSTPFSQPVAPTPAVQQPSVQQTGAPTQSPSLVMTGPTNDRFVEIHQNLKKLRSLVEEAAKSHMPQLKKHMGDMRRELRKNVGQLVSGKGGNKAQVNAIQDLLNKSLNGSIKSPPVEPSNFITDRREPVEGAVHNEPTLPSLFIYLLSHFSKTIISQFINECGAQPKSADPIGVVAAQIFSNPSYHWRGRPLIDILMAKFRVVCPVLFGYRGSEQTEQGRLRIGWKREEGSWAPEQQHIDRMKGLAVGYAAISLRDFTKSPKSNPWPPSHYWTAMAKIVNTPANEISNTQCIVLRSMIELYEERFLAFYGSAAIAALRKALVEFPTKAPGKMSGVTQLQALAAILKRDLGLEL